jgi:hypothetical protein
VDASPYHTRLLSVQCTCVVGDSKACLSLLIKTNWLVACNHTGSIYWARAQSLAQAMFRLHTVKVCQSQRRYRREHVAAPHPGDQKGDQNQNVQLPAARQQLSGCQALFTTRSAPQIATRLRTSCPRPRPNHPVDSATAQPWQKENGVGGRPTPQNTRDNHSLNVCPSAAQAMMTRVHVTSQPIKLS